MIETTPHPTASSAKSPSILVTKFARISSARQVIGERQDSAEGETNKSALSDRSSIPIAAKRNQSEKVSLQNPPRRKWVRNFG